MKYFFFKAKKLKILFKVKTALRKTIFPNDILNILLIKVYKYFFTILKKEKII